MSRTKKSVFSSISQETTELEQPAVVTSLKRSLGKEFQQFLTKYEVAEYTNVSIKTVERWMKRGLAYVKIGSTVRISAADLISFLNEYRITA